MPTAYRFEIAKQGRAGCSNKACKDEGVKILKGELRFGVLVTIKDHDSWKWRHWGCVTPQIIHNVMEQVGEDIDLDEDIDVLDGADELEPWAQDKVKKALRQGHVDDSDWKGDPELNRPGQKGFKKRTPKKKAEDEDEGAGDVASSPTPRAKKSAKSKKVKDEDAGAGNDPASVLEKKGRGNKLKIEGEEDVKPVKKSASRKRKTTADVEGFESDEEPLTPPTKKSKSTAKTTTSNDAADNKQKRSRKAKEQQLEESEEEAVLPQYSGSTATGDQPARKSKKAKQAQEDAEDENNEAEEEPADPKAGKKSRSKKTDDSDELRESVKSAQHGRKSGQTKEKDRKDAKEGEDHHKAAAKKRGRKPKA